MSAYKTLRLAAALLPLFATLAGAADPAATPVDAAVAKKLYLTKTCVACHGKDGRKPIQDYPALAGQRADYMIAQIGDILSGARTGSPDKTGNPRAKGMRGVLVDPQGNRRISDEEIATVSHWLASLEPAPVAPLEAPLSPEQIAEAEKLYAETCEACHGPGAREPQETFPVIAGQKRAYALAQMLDIKSGARSNGQSEAMKAIVAEIPDESLALLADYISQLPAVAP